MNYSDRLQLMAALEEKRKAFAHEIEVINKTLDELRKIDELECKIQEQETFDRKMWTAQINALPKTDKELKEIEEAKQLMANRGHWVVKDGRGKGK